MYNFMGIILEAQVSFIFFAFMHSFQNCFFANVNARFSDFGDFQTLCVIKGRDSHMRFGFFRACAFRARMLSAQQKTQVHVNKCVK